MLSFCETTECSKYNSIYCDIVNVVVHIEVAHCLCCFCCSFCMPPTITITLAKCCFGVTYTVVTTSLHTYALTRVGGYVFWLPSAAHRYVLIKFVLVIHKTLLNGN